MGGAEVIAPSSKKEVELYNNPIFVWINRFLLTSLLLLWGFGFSRGKPPFMCRDDTIQHVYSGDTIPFYVLLSICLVLPRFFIRYFYSGGSEEYRVHKYLFYMTLLYPLFLNEVTKCYCCAPRPHFMDTCDPDVDRETCHTIG
ncbi:unnamed protein product [Cyprideis torosa]|uniref:Uncharacterized protein n=1 Tax=Cyprideis torosa TaxID=163714 RepID=A0A7R8W7Y7_9CRUS|nr:unnamed protein product [Cyprideis torosa]CAG0888058.1 unnamed protein product [Cyprideis torosa]